MWQHQGGSTFQAAYFALTPLRDVGQQRRHGRHGLGRIVAGHHLHLLNMLQQGRTLHGSRGELPILPPFTDRLQEIFISSQRLEYALSTSTTIKAATIQLPQTFLQVHQHIIKGWMSFGRPLLSGKERPAPFLSVKHPIEGRVRVEG